MFLCSFAWRRKFALVWVVLPPDQIGKNPVIEKGIYTSVVPKRSSDSIVEQLQSLIIERRLAAGDSLPAERELATTLGVSRNVLREALSVLGQRGLVTVLPGRGSFVAQPSTNVMQESLQLLLSVQSIDLRDLAEARLLIEPELAARAAALRSTAEIETLASLFAALEGSQNRPAEHVQADLAFHDEIARVANQPVLRAVVDALREPMLRGMLIGSNVASAPDHSDSQHRRIFAAIAAGDSDEARQAMRDHIEFVGRYIRAFADSKGATE